MYSVESCFWYKLWIRQRAGFRWGRLRGILGVAFELKEIVKEGNSVPCKVGELFEVNYKNFPYIIKSGDGEIVVKNMWRKMAVLIWAAFINETEIHRGKAIDYWLKKNGVPIIPNFSWGDERTYEFCFDGIERRGKSKLDIISLFQVYSVLLSE